MKKNNQQKPASDWVSQFCDLTSVIKKLDNKTHAEAARFIIRNLLDSLAAKNNDDARNAHLNCLTLGCFEFQKLVLSNRDYAALTTGLASVPALLPSSRKEREQLAQQLKKAGFNSMPLFKETLKKRRIRPEVERAKAFALLADAVKKLSSSSVASGIGIDTVILKPLEALPPLTASTLNDWQNAFWRFSCEMHGSEKALLESQEWADKSQALMDQKTKVVSIARGILRQEFDRALAQVLKVSGK